MNIHRKCRRSRVWIRAQWRGHVEAQASSGLSGQAYCRRHGLRAKSFYRWRRLLGDSVSAGKPGARGDEPAPLPVFAEVRVCDGAAGPSSAMADGGARVEVVTRGGRAIRVWPGFDGETLARAVSVLEGVPC